MTILMICFQLTSLLCFLSGNGLHIKDLTENGTISYIKDEKVLVFAKYFSCLFFLVGLWFICLLNLKKHSLF